MFVARRMSFSNIKGNSVNTTSCYATTLPFKSKRSVARRILTALLALAAAAGPAIALADGDTAKANLVANLTRAGATLPDLNAAGTTIFPTLVKGLYAIHAADGSLITNTNEAGTITGRSIGFNSVGLQPGKPRPLTPEQVAGLRAEVMANIQYDKLIKVVYGNGGGRKILMFSALDCPGCTRLEKGLHKAAPAMNTTFYVVAGSLQEMDRGAMPFLQNVARIRCDSNPAQAWQTYWATRAVPPKGACALTPIGIEREFYSLFGILEGLKSIKPLFPMLVGEDGKWIPLIADMAPAKAEAAFGPERKRQAIQPTTQWLAAAKAR